MENSKQTMYMAILPNSWGKGFTIESAVVNAAKQTGGGNFTVYRLEGTPQDIHTCHVDGFGRFSYPTSVDIQRDYASGTVQTETNYDEEDYAATNYQIKLDIGEEE